MTTTAGRARVGTSLVLAVFVLVAVVVRFVTQSPLWLDEALSVNLATLDLRDLPEALRHDGHPPLYYVLLHAWTEVFGTGDSAVRSLSGVLSVASLPLAWTLGRRIGGRDAAVAATVLMGLSPFCVRYATEARMYSLVMLLVLAGTLLVRDALDEQRVSLARLVGLAAVSGALLLSHYWSVWLVGATILALLPRAWRGEAGFRPVALAVAGGGLALLPWLPSLLDQLRHTGTPWGSRVRPTSAVADTLEHLGGGDFGEAILLGLLIVVLAVLALFVHPGATDARLELDLRTVPGVRGELGVSALALLGGATIGWITDSTYAARYAAIVVPLVLVAAGVGLARLPVRARWVMGAATVGLSLVGVGNNVVEDRTQAEVVAQAIAARAEPGDVVGFCPDQLGPAVARALDQAGARVVGITFPDAAPPQRVDWADYEDRVAAADPVAFARQLDEAAGPGRVFFVSSGAYRTHRTVCAEIGSALQRLRPRARPLVSEDTEFFEHASLAVYRGGR